MILDEIVAATRKRVALVKGQEQEVRVQAETLAAQETERFPFEERLRRTGMNVICEVKKASPSKGVIAETFPYVDIAREYERAGAAAISVLTEPDFFQGSLAFLTEISKEVSIPLLRKDFVIDAVQIYEAKAAGASAVLLICAILSQEQLREYIELCNALHLSALVEAHDEEEVALAVRAGARVIGVNNRNLKNFQVDITNSMRLRSLVGEEVLFVAESGIKTREQVRQLEGARVNGILIGETLMRADDKKKMLHELLTDFGG